MSDLISIIIPVYNLEKYIENCLNTIINQTYRNIEIICVDDGSTDDSADIIKRFAETDSRIRYIYKENSGVSATRNAGLDSANGSYIMFVDGDDYLHTQAVGLMADCAFSTDADIVCAGYKRTDKTNEVMQPIEENRYTKVGFEKIFLDKQGLQLGETVWSKLIKQELCSQLRFHTDLYYSEDTLFTVELFKKASSVYFIDKQIYYYLLRSNSAVTTPFNRKRLTILTAYDRMCESTAECDNGILRFFCLKGLFKHIRYSRMKVRFSEIRKEVRSECKRLGRKWLKALLKEPAAGTAQKAMIFAFYYSQLSYELAMLIKEPQASLKIYKRRWKDRHNSF